MPYTREQLEEKMQDVDFRAAFYQLEAQVLRRSLELCCLDHGSVRAGFEELGDKVNFYIQSAMQEADSDIPKDAFIDTAVKVLNEASNVPSPSAETES